MTTEHHTPATPQRVLGDSRGERTIVALIGSSVLALALTGMYVSFRTVYAYVLPYFHGTAWAVPSGVDLAILVFSAADLMLMYWDIPMPGLRMVPWAFTAATIALNWQSGGPLPIRIAHAAMPSLWVIFCEYARHVIRHRVGLVAGTRMEKIRKSRWFLAPWSTARMWRRMILWEITNYRSGLDMEADRLTRRALLELEYGRRWRRKAPATKLLPLKLGALAPADTLGELTRTGLLDLDFGAIGGAQRERVQAPASAPALEPPPRPPQAQPLQPQPQPQMFSPPPPPAQAQSPAPSPIPSPARLNGVVPPQRHEPAHHAQFNGFEPAPRQPDGYPVHQPDYAEHVNHAQLELDVEPEPRRAEPPRAEAPRPQRPQPQPQYGQRPEPPRYDLAMRFAAPPALEEPEDEEPEEEYIPVAKAPVEPTVVIGKQRQQFEEELDRMVQDGDHRIFSPDMRELSAAAWEAAETLEPSLAFERAARYGAEYRDRRMAKGMTMELADALGIEYNGDQ